MKNQETFGEKQEDINVLHISSVEEMDQGHNEVLAELYRKMRLLIRGAWDDSEMNKNKITNEVGKLVSVLEDKKAIVFDISKEDLITQIIESIFIDEKRLENKNLRNWYNHVVAEQVVQDVVGSNPEALSDGYWDKGFQSDLYTKMRSGEVRSDMFSKLYYPEEEWVKFTEIIDKSLVKQCDIELNAAHSSNEQVSE